MKRIDNILPLFLVIILIVNYGCIEELDLESAITDEGTGLLVVEATLTDKVERQKVYLSRSEARFDLETDTVYSYVLPLGVGNRDSVIVEQNALVRVVSASGQSFGFEEEAPGTYLSTQPFGLQLGQEYNLEITTSDGDEYTSDNLLITEKSEYESVAAKRVVNDEGIEGVNIMVSSRPVVGNPSLYRYTYDETFKIIAPNWNPKEFLLENYDPCGSPELATYDLSIIEKEIQNQVCYQTVPSNTFILTNLTDDENKLKDFSVRFIDRDNFIISHRYSINIRQYTLSIESYNFYDAIDRLATSDNVFSQVQTGSLEANVYRKDGRKEMILGYIDAASVSEKRIYFNYEDLFPGESLPPFPYNCEEFARHEGHYSYCRQDIFHNVDQCPQSLVEMLNLDLITYVGPNNEMLDPCEHDIFGEFGPHIMVSRICGDCTILGDNIAPDWWEE